MSIPLVLLPVFVQVGLTLGLLFWLGPMRVSALREGQVQPSEIVLGQKVWPARALQIGNAFDNQFQLPVLFYVIVALALFTRQADLLFVLMSWIFVVSRLVHAFIHTGSNHLVNRFRAYLVGVVVLTLMWII